MLTRVVKVSPGRITLAPAAGGPETVLEADHVILAGPRRSRQELVQPLDYGFDELNIIGDAVAPRSLAIAIQEGHKLGVRA